MLSEEELDCLKGSYSISYLDETDYRLLIDSNLTDLTYMVKDMVTEKDVQEARRIVMKLDYLLGEVLK